MDTDIKSCTFSNCVSEDSQANPRGGYGRKCRCGTDSDISYLKVNHNACSLHLATHFQNQTSHMGMLYMVY